MASGRMSLPSVSVILEAMRKRTVGRGLSVHVCVCVCWAELRGCPDVSFYPSSGCPSWPPLCPYPAEASCLCLCSVSSDGEPGTVRTESYNLGYRENKERPAMLGASFWS